MVNDLQKEWSQQGVKKVSSCHSTDLHSTKNVGKEVGTAVSASQQHKVASQLPSKPLQQAVLSPVSIKHLTLPTCPKIQNKVGLWSLDWLSQKPIF